MDYTTVKNPASAEFVEKKSRFIGHIRPVRTKAEAEAFIAQIKAKHRDATHNVSAYLVKDERIERYSDDGEPQGTAGIPALDVLKKEGLTDVCVVVTRYFGGILLGGGGLVRAYSHSCKLAVDAAQVIHMRAGERLRVQFSYSLYGKVSYLLPSYQLKQEDADFADMVTLTLLVRKDQAQKLKDDLVELTNGQIQLQFIEDAFSEF